MGGKGDISAFDIDIGSIPGGSIDKVDVGALIEIALLRSGLRRRMSVRAFICGGVLSDLIGKQECDIGTDGSTKGGKVGCGETSLAAV